MSMLTSKNEYVSIFEDGKLKPGIYKIQNIVSQTYVVLQDHTRELCCRPTTVLEDNRLWEILPSGPGNTIHRHEPGKPEQFCTVLGGLTQDEHGRMPISVSTFPVAWRLEMVHDEPYRGCEYVRFFWGTTTICWDLADYGSAKDYTPVHYTSDNGFQPCRIWKLIPVKLDGGPWHSVSKTTSSPLLGLGHLPPYDRSPGNQRYSCSHQTMEREDDEFGTTVTEVTTTTSTVTTRKKYRVIALEKYLVGLQEIPERFQSFRNFVFTFESIISRQE